MLKEHEDAPSGQFGALIGTDSHIQSKTNAKTFMSPNFLKGHKTREIGRAEIYKQLSSGR